MCDKFIFSLIYCNNKKYKKNKQLNNIFLIYFVVPCQGIIILFGCFECSEGNISEGIGLKLSVWYITLIIAILNFNRFAL